jgi:hypothetical protein
MWKHLLPSCCNWNHPVISIACQIALLVTRNSIQQYKIPRTNPPFLITTTSSSSSSSRLQVWHNSFFSLSTYHTSHFLKNETLLCCSFHFHPFLHYCHFRPFFWQKRLWIKLHRNYCPPWVFKIILRMSDLSLFFQDCAAALGPGIVSCITAAVQEGLSELSRWQLMNFPLTFNFKIPFPMLAVWFPLVMMSSIRYVQTATS